MTCDDKPKATTRWLDYQWQSLQPELPAAPAQIIELGCGPYGGFVPELLRAGYQAVGIDPEAPAGPEYHQTGIEAFTPAAPADGLIACVSLHHTHDLAAVLDQVGSILRPDGVIIVVEWDWQRFDDRTAQWCFDRLGRTDEEGWLHRHRAQWQESGRTWSDYLTGWAEAENLHPADAIVQSLQSRFATRRLARGPYVFAELDDVSPADELRAIEAGQVQTTCVHFVGTSGDSQRPAP